MILLHKFERDAKTWRRLIVDFRVAELWTEWDAEVTNLLCACAVTLFPCAAIVVLRIS